MRRKSFWFRMLLGFATALASFASVEAAVPSEKLLPDTTKGYLAIPNLKTLEENFNATQIGQLMSDPVMKPFAEDLKRQLRSKWRKSYNKLGITWSDLRDVPSGEIAVALIQPSPKQGVVAVVADVSGKLDEARKLLAKIDKNLLDKKATKTTKEVAGQTITIYTYPKKQDQKKSDQAAFVLHSEHHQLVAADSLAVLEAIVARFDGEADDNLIQHKAYDVATARIRQQAGELVPHVRWFVEPFGYLEASRARSANAEKPKPNDLINVLQKQGFTCIQGLAGYINFSDGPHDILHRTMVYAPAVEREDGDTNTDKYDLAARMLNLPNNGNHLPPAWIPRGLATFVSVNLDLKNGFEYSKTLVNEMAQDEIFEDVLKSVKEDPKGPKVDIREDLVANLGEHVMVLSDYELPITTKSERLLFAIELSNPAIVEAMINKIMESDPDAEKRIFGKGDRKWIVWEVIQEEDADVIEVDIDFEFEIGLEEDEEPEEKKALSNSAVTVAHGHLIIATHVDFIFKVLREADDRQTLAGSVDYKIIREALKKLGASNNCAVSFSRTDEEYRPTYELLRQGKMPESETFIGKVLNKFLDSDLDDDVLRKQKIDGSKLPEFQIARRYLGPAGLYANSLEDGWIITGCFLGKGKPQVAMREEKK